MAFFGFIAGSLIVAYWVWMLWTILVTMLEGWIKKDDPSTPAEPKVKRPHSKYRPSMKLPLESGGHASVDAKDYDHLCGYRWRTNAQGYVERGAHVSYNVSTKWKYGNRDKRLHRLLMNPSSDLVVDHKNGNRLDNRRRNLRICTPGQNSINAAGHKGSSSRYKGVSKTTGGKWKAAIGTDGKNLGLGTYEVQKDAALAFDAAARKYQGDFARLNFPKTWISEEELFERRTPGSRSNAAQQDAPESEDDRFR